MSWKFQWNWWWPLRGTPPGAVLALQLRLMFRDHVARTQTQSGQQKWEWGWKVAVISFSPWCQHLGLDTDGSTKDGAEVEPASPGWVGGKGRTFWRPPSLEPAWCSTPRMELAKPRFRAGERAWVGGTAENPAALSEEQRGWAVTWLLSLQPPGLGSNTNFYESHSKSLQNFKICTVNWYFFVYYIAMVPFQVCF